MGRIITKTYIKRLIQLAEDIREYQLKSIKEVSPRATVDLASLRTSSKINHLLGYILALRDIDNGG